MKSFDEFYWKHNDCLNKDTLLAHSFGEKVWIHKQQEVDELRKKLEKSEYLGNEHLEARRRLYKDNCELQKRIDNALSKSKDFYDFGDGESAMAFCNEIINILKGENHES